MSIDGKINYVFKINLYNIYWYTYNYFLEKKYDNHSQTQDYCPHNIHDIMMQPANQNADQQDCQKQVLRGIGTFTQWWLCDIHFYFNFDTKVSITNFDVSGTNEDMKCSSLHCQFDQLSFVEFLIIVIIVHYYTDQCQNETHLTNKLVVPKKRSHAIQIMMQHAMMSYQVALHLIIILLSMVQIF